MTTKTFYLPVPLLKRSRKICFCVFAHNLADFSVVFEENLVVNSVLTQKMEQLYANDRYHVDPTDVYVNMPVAARYVSGDLSWYRAKVTAIDAAQDDYDVYFVDYAHAQTNSLQQLRSLPAELTEKPPLAIQCRLFGIQDYDWNAPAVNSSFCQLIFKQWNKGKCVVSFLTEEPPHWVRVWNSETGEELLPEMVGAKRRPVPAQPPPPVQNEDSVAETEDLLVLGDADEAAPVANAQNDQFGFVESLVANLKQASVATSEQKPKPTTASRRDAAIQTEKGAEDAAAAPFSAQTAIAALDAARPEEVEQVLKIHFPAMSRFLNLK